jgi:hypothetical protein
MSITPVETLMGACIMLITFFDHYPAWEASLQRV